MHRRTGHPLQKPEVEVLNQPTPSAAFPFHRETSPYEDTNNERHHHKLATSLRLPFHLVLPGGLFQQN